MIDTILFENEVAVSYDPNPTDDEDEDDDAESDGSDSGGLVQKRMSHHMRHPLFLNSSQLMHLMMMRPHLMEHCQNIHFLLRMKS